MASELDKGCALTRKVQTEIVEALAEGNYLSVACRSAGITRQTFEYWKHLCEDGVEHAQTYAKFFAACARAEAIAERNAVSMMSAGTQGWQGPAHFLARRHYRRWGNKETIVIQRGDDFDPSKMTDDELREIAKGKGKRRA